MTLTPITGSGSATFAGAWGWSGLPITINVTDASAVYEDALVVQFSSVYTTNPLSTLTAWVVVTMTDVITSATSTTTFYPYFEGTQWFLEEGTYALPFPGPNNADVQCVCHLLDPANSAAGQSGILDAGVFDQGGGED